MRPGIRRQGKREAGASRQPGSSDSGSRGSGAPKKGNYRPRRITGQQPKGSRRVAGGRYRRGFCAALSWRVPGALRPGSRNRAPCRNLTADRSEASHCPAPVAGERQLRPRSHGHGHTVHSFIAPPHRMPALGPRTNRIPVVVVVAHPRLSAATLAAARAAPWKAPRPAPTLGPMVDDTGEHLHDG